MAGAGADVEAATPVLASSRERPTTVRCWLCHIELMVPAEGSALKCCECGAITDVLPARRHRPDACGDHCATFLDALPMGFVLSAFAVVIGTGCWFVLPLLYPEGGVIAACHYALAVVLGANTTFHYVASVVAEPDDTRLVTRADLLQRDRSSWENWRWCSACEAPKPPRARHCSSCGQCIPRMDHHCIYLGRCVGLHNHAHFLRFLGWLWASTVYVSVMCAFATANIHLPMHELLVLNGKSNAEALQALQVYLAKTKFMAGVGPDQYATELATIFELVVGVLTSSLIAVLLRMQLWYVCRGTTYVEYHFDGAPYAAQFDHGTGENLAVVFGESHPLTWMLPPRLQYRVPKAKKTR